MSQRETIKAITCEWMTTPEIADRVPRSRGVDKTSHLRAVFKDLQTLEKHGEVQAIRTHGKPTKWRGF